MTRRTSSARRISSDSAPPAPAKLLARGNNSNANSKKPSPWAEPSPAQIERAIRDSALPIVVALEIAPESETESSRLPLLECGLSSWQELVKLQCAVDTLQRPTRDGKDGQREEDSLECMVFGSPAKPELQLSPGAVNSVHKFATTLLLRLQSLGFSVRSLLKDRVLVRLPAGAAPVNTRKWVQWDAVVVTPEVAADDQAPEWIQRVMLPPVETLENPLEHLRHPRLLPMVDSMLEDHARSGRIHVVVLRGIPGSGKSSLGREIVTICEARGARVVVCSADVYFETPRGYRFDVKAISKAHEASQKRFRDTLQEKQAAVVVVDNTHTQKWEYDVYEQAAVERGCPVHILEMHCPDVLTSQRMAERNSHGVSVVKVMAMYLRWDADDRATLFDASFQDALVLENPVTRNPLNNHVAYVGLFLDPTARSKVLERLSVRHTNVVAEHITLFFRPTTQYLRQAPIGRKFTVRVTSIVEDAKGQALQVELDDRLPLRCMNKIPHITVSTAQGISAFYSNELLENPNATRTPVDDVWEIEVTLGITLMAQNHKIVSLASPFARQFSPTNASEAVSADSTRTQCDSLVVLDVDATELQESMASNTIEHTLLRNELVRHLSGPQATSQRIVAVRNATITDRASETELIAAVHKQFSPAWISDSLRFDSVVFLKTGETLASTLQKKNAEDKRVVVITTQSAPHVAKELNHTGACVTVKQLPRFGPNDHLCRLAPSLDASLTRALDAMRVAPSEEACFTTQKAIHVAESALKMCGMNATKVMRVDSALWAHPSSLVEIAATAPMEDCSIEKLVAAIKTGGVRDVAVVDEGEPEVTLQFQLSTKSTQTPVVRWIVARSRSESTQACTRLQIVRDLRRRTRDSLSPENQELYPRAASVISAVLRGNLMPAIPRGTLQLLSERATLEFFASCFSNDVATVGGKVMDHAVMWSRLGECVRWLAQWTSERWKSEIGALGAATSATDEVANRICSVFHAASDAFAADAETINVKTGSPAWGQKLRSILALAGSQK